MGRWPRSLLFVKFFLSLSVFSVSEFIPPQALFNVAHIKFPQDRIVGQNFRFQADRYGLGSESRCSSLIGPRCASPEAISDSGQRSLFEGQNDREQQNVKVVFLELTGDDIIEADGYLKLSEDALRDLRHELGLKELSVEKLTRMDPEWVAKVADTVAEAMGIEDKETFKHRVMSDFSAMLTKSSDPQPTADDGDEARDGIDVFMLHPTNLKYEVEQQEGAGAHYMDRTARVVVDGISQIFMDRKDKEDEYLDVEDEDYDEYLDYD
ncbi:hypothetical protein BSKO_04392 [Bryopsis sp. KO-2023]|nr:hypothetical protein BSKO_04392 [Bryopsis sp. KO-2023]